jgi:hypothetical protein
MQRTIAVGIVIIERKGAVAAPAMIAMIGRGASASLYTPQAR